MTGPEPWAFRTRASGSMLPAGARWAGKEGPHGNTREAPGPGAMPPFANLFGLPVYVDRSLEADEQIVVQAGTHTDTVRLKYTDFARLVQPTIADFVA